jgi:hypothetical protein
MFNKERMDKVGYLDRPDSMRDFAEKEASRCGAKGSEKKMSSGGHCAPKKMAEGGIGKIRHGQSTASGMPKDMKKVRNTGVYY